MHLNIVARMEIKVVKAGAYQNHGLMMAKEIVTMVQMKVCGNSKLDNFLKMDFWKRLPKNLILCALQT